MVSGAAIGIDGAAHRGALAVDGPTVAVLACGVDRAYPAAHQRLLERIAATGLVVSEYPPGCVPARHRFLVRNRLIAGLAAGTRRGRGRAAQRRPAHRGGRRVPSAGLVMAVPGPVTSAMSAGCHQLIRDGAPCWSPAPRRCWRRSARSASTSPPSRRAGPTGPPTGSTRRGRAVHDALPARAARDTRWLALEAGVPIGAVRVALVDLERRGLVEHRDGRWRRRPADGSRRRDDRRPAPAECVRHAWSRQLWTRRRCAAGDADTLTRCLTAAVAARTVDGCPRLPELAPGPAAALEAFLRHLRWSAGARRTPCGPTAAT